MRVGRRHIGYLVLGACLVGAILLGDPHVWLFQSHSSVSVDDPAHETFDTALQNTLQSSYTMDGRFRGGENETQLLIRVSAEYTPTPRTLHSYGFVRENGSYWLVTERYTTESVSATRHGQSNTPTRQNLSLELTERSATFARLPQATLTPPLMAEQAAPDELEYLTVTEETLVVGVTGPNAYARFSGTSPDQYRAASYRAYIDRETGYLTRVVENTTLVTSEGEVIHSHDSLTFSKIGNTTTNRPDWVGPVTLDEILYDLASP